MRTFMKISLPLALAMICGTITAFAQAGGSTSEIKGKVSDPNGAVVAGATVTATDADRGATRTSTTNADGDYRFLSLTPGTYNLSVQASGFGRLVKNGLRVTVGQTADFDFSLKVGDTSVIVEVTSDPLAIETDSSQQSTTINERFIRDLPIDRRDYLTFTLLTPGVVDANSLADNSDFRVAQTPQSGISFYGNNGRGNSVTVDGAEANDQGGGVRSTLSQETVQEFQINRSNYNAELGGASGGVINIVSKTGTNNVHGSVFGYFRHQSLDAADPFAVVLTGNTLSRVKPQANRQQYGFTIGGPIKKDKTFIYGGYEGLKRRESSVVSVLNDLRIFQPTAAQQTIINGLATQANQTPITCFTGQAMITPAQCTGALQTTLTAKQSTQDLFRNNSGVFPFDSNSNAASVRLDHIASQSNTYFLRYSYTKRDDSNQAIRALVGFSRANNTDNLDHNIVGNWTHIFSPSTINEVRVQGNYNKLNVVSTDPNGPELNVTGFGFFNRDIFLPAFNTDRRLEVADNLSVVRGSHRMKFGGSVLIRSGFFDDKTFFSGRFGFSVLPASFVSPQLAATTINQLQGLDLGLPTSYQQGFGNGIVGAKIPYYAVYGQDTWNATSRLTFNYGLRYEIDVRRKPLRTSYGNFGPRVGLSWDPYGDKKTVVRAGYGIFYAQIPFVIDYVVQSLNEIDGFRQIPQVLTTLNAANPLAINGPVNIFRTLRAQGVIGIPNTIRTISPSDLTQFGITVSQTGPRNPLTVLFRADPTYQSPRAQQGSIAVEQELSPGFTFGVSYTWALTQHITRARDMNLRDRPIGPRGIREWGGASAPDCAGAGVVNCFINPTLFQEIIYESAASANYHGIVAEFNKQIGRNISISGNYTYSEANDQVTDYNSDFRANDQLDERSEYSLSAFDQRHKFVIYGVLQSSSSNAFLRDWVLTPIFRANSGRPFNLLAGADVNSDRSTNGDRPLFVTGGVPSGSIARNTGEGPSFSTFDMRVTRKIRFNENVSLDLTAEAFNLLNRLNFASVNNTVGTTFDRTEGIRGRTDVGPSSPLGFTSAFDPRRIQLGVKLRF